MNFHWGDLSHADAPWAYVCFGTERSIGNMVGIERYENPMREYGTRIVRGSRCRTRDALFQEIAAALQFPYYFGHNWDALDECMRDLEWLPGPKHVVVLTRVEEALSGSEREFGILTDIFRTAATTTEAEGGTDVPFRVVFHAERASADAAEERLRNAGVPYVTLQLPEGIENL